MALEAAVQNSRHRFSVGMLLLFSACVILIFSFFSLLFLLAASLMKTQGMEPNFYKMICFRATTTKAIM